jgi:hypothetical protein
MGALTGRLNGMVKTALVLDDVAAIATVTAIDVENFASGIVITPASLASTALNFYISHDGTTYVLLHTAASAPVTVVCDNAAKAYVIPPSVFTSKYLKIVSGSDETGKTVTAIFAT